VWGSSAKVSRRTYYPLKNHVSIDPVVWKVAVPLAKGSGPHVSLEVCTISYSGVISRCELLSYVSRGVCAHVCCASSIA
jgi:hypothetical protein